MARGDITKGYATYVRLVILLLMKLSLMNYHGNDIGIQSSEKNCRGKQRVMMITKITVQPTLNRVESKNETQTLLKVEITSQYFN